MSSSPEWATWLIQAYAIQQTTTSSTFVFLPGEFLCVTSPISAQSSRPLKAVAVELFTTIALFMSFLAVIYTNI